DLLGLGSLEDFDFIEPPDHRLVNDGRKLLIELGAMSEKKSNPPKSPFDNGGLEKAALATEKSSFNNGVLQSKGDTLTKIGQQMAKMPIDPRLARMILGGAHFGVLNEVLIIVAALAVQDPRERPADKQMQADQKHALFREADSDFLFYIKLWETLQGNRESMSENKRRTFARNH